MISLDSLSTEILSLIVSHVDSGDLYACALVNQRFYLITNPMLWRNVFLHNYNSGYNFNNTTIKSSQFLITIAMSQNHVGRHIRKVDLSHFKWTDHSFFFLMQHASQLEDLIINYGTGITDISFKHFPHYCPNIHSLYLSHSPITLQSIRALDQNSHKLKKLSLWYCPKLCLDTFSALAHCPLVELNMELLEPNNDDNESNDDIDDDSDNLSSVTANWKVSKKPTTTTTTTTTTIAADSTPGHRLTHLEISFPTITMMQRTTAFIDNQRRAGTFFLTELTIDEPLDCRDSDVIALLRAWPDNGLKHFSLTFCQSNDIVLDAIIACHPDIMTVDLCHSSQLTSRGVRRLVRRCHQLTLVSMKYCNFPVDDFPEAGQHCLGSEGTPSDLRLRVQYLDSHAINKIRLCSFDPLTH